MSEITALEKVKAQMRVDGALEPTGSKSKIKPAQVIIRGSVSGTADNFQEKDDAIRSPQGEGLVNSDVE